MTRQEMHELALAYLQQRLTIEEKLEVFRLIMENDDFFKFFELALLRRFAPSKTVAPCRVRERVQEKSSLSCKTPKGHCRAGHYQVLRGTMPQIAWAVYQPWQGGCLLMKGETPVKELAS